MSQASLSAVITTIPIASLRRGSQQPQVHDNPQVQGKPEGGNTKHQNQHTRWLLYFTMYHFNLIMNLCKVGDCKVMKSYALHSKVMVLGHFDPAPLVF